MDPGGGSGLQQIYSGRLFRVPKNDAYDVDQAIVPTMSTEQLEDHCRRYDLFADCMVQVKPYCNSLEKKKYEGIDDAYDYLCKTHKDEYLQHRECLQNKDLHREGRICNDTLERKLQELGPQTANYKRDRICQYAEDYFYCVEDTVESFCGWDAAKWQRGMDELSLKPLLITIGCPNWQEQDTGDGGSRLSSIISLLVAGLVASLRF